MIRLCIRAVDRKSRIEEAEERRLEERLQAWLEHAVDLHAPAQTPLVEITNRAVQDLGSLALLEGRAD